MKRIFSLETQKRYRELGEKTMFAVDVYSSTSKINKLMDVNDTNMMIVEFFPSLALAYISKVNAALCRND